VSEAECVLVVSFESAEAFQREYAANLVNGGVFVASDELLDLRTRVQVKLLLRFCGKQIGFAGEIVHQVTPEMAQLGAPAGVAVQFDKPAHQVREWLEPLREASGAPEHSLRRSGKRDSPRVPARVPARVAGADAELEGLTRNLSRSGVLVSVPGQGVPIAWSSARSRRTAAGPLSASSSCRARRPSASSRESRAPSTCGASAASAGRSPSSAS